MGTSPTPIPTPNPPSPISHKGRNITISIVIILLLTMFVFILPIFPDSYQEPYVVQVPYTSMANRELELGSTSDYTLQANSYYYWGTTIPLGRDVEFSISASDTVNLYVFTETQFNSYKAGQSTPNEKSLIGLSSGKLGYHIASTGTYYFVIYNPHTGFLGIGAKSVGIYSALVKAYWQEEVTLYRDETRYKTISLTVTLWQLLTGSYKPR